MISLAGLEVITEAWARAWLVAMYKVFAEFNTLQPAFNDYEATILAGRAAHFLSSNNQLGQLDSEEIRTRRKLESLKRSETPPLHMARRLKRFGIRVDVSQ